MATSVQDILSRRNVKVPGGESIRFLELYGRRFVPLSFVEPDPNTAHGKYYYNTRTNVLYRKVIAGDRYVWKRVS